MKKQDPLQHSSGKAKSQDIQYVVWKAEKGSLLGFRTTHTCAFSWVSCNCWGVHVRPGIAAYSIGLGGGEWLLLNHTVTCDHLPCTRWYPAPSVFVTKSVRLAIYMAMRVSPYESLSPPIIHPPLLSFHSTVTPHTDPSNHPSIRPIMIHDGSTIPESFSQETPRPPYSQPSSFKLTTHNMTKPSVVEWDWNLEHADRKREAKADSAVHGAQPGPFLVDRNLLRDVIREKLGCRVGRITFLNSGASSWPLFPPPNEQRARSGYHRHVS
jgi:hypothetical protein